MAYIDIVVNNSNSICYVLIYVVLRNPRFLSTIQCSSMSTETRKEGRKKHSLKHEHKCNPSRLLDWPKLYPCRPQLLRYPLPVAFFFITLSRDVHYVWVKHVYALSHLSFKFSCQLYIQFFFQGLDMEPSSARTSYRQTTFLMKWRWWKFVTIFYVEQMPRICHVLYHIIKGEVPLHSAI